MTNNNLNFSVITTELLNYYIISSNYYLIGCSNGSTTTWVLLNTITLWNPLLTITSNIASNGHYYPVITYYYSDMQDIETVLLRSITSCVTRRCSSIQHLLTVHPTSTLLFQFSPLNLNTSSFPQRADWQFTYSVNWIANSSTPFGQVKRNSMMHWPVLSLACCQEWRRSKLEVNMGQDAPCFCLGHFNSAVYSVAIVVAHVSAAHEQREESIHTSDSIARAGEQVEGEGPGGYWLPEIEILQAVEARQGRQKRPKSSTFNAGVPARQSQHQSAVALWRQDVGVDSSAICSSPQESSHVLLAVSVVLSSIE